MCDAFSLKHTYIYSREISECIQLKIASYHFKFKLILVFISC